MKLSLVTETYPPEINGVAMTLSQLVTGMREKGHQVQVVRPSQSAEEPYALADQSTVTVPGAPIPRYPDLRFGIPCRNRLIYQWRRWQPDVVHIATEGPLGLSAILAAKRILTPTTSTFHTNFHSYSEHYNAKFFTSLVLAFLRWIHNQTRCTMAPTRELADQLGREGFRNMDVFGRGVHLTTFNPAARDEQLRQSWGAKSGDPVFIHVSRLASEKNYQLLKKCYDAIRQRHGNARFVIVGGGPLEPQLRKSFPYAVFTGPIPLENRALLARHYASADAFLYPSTTETYGNVTTEAMACGNAVLAYDYAAAALHIEHNKNGLLAPLGDESEFLANSLRLAGDLSLRQRLGTAAVAYAPHFDWQPAIDRFEAILLHHIEAAKARR
ncbi:glycosyltransferase family 1 protein [Pelagicoccus sp. SDUM812003]|uniref:glycosyltransferase family 4 protein n=1 Tax=Pelagicoccus sp. SDUM812003 TaxID=3041267 RepID=UPI0028103BFD|nr:glycosyltransferase family 1 protein [Pelagicoccus sp. SDUM812003]MDQ8203439.1 glycosyltransferase family 1 protein [Pelagicoccus sp. SDUM812003]